MPELETDLIANLRRQLEKLNDLRFTDDEWTRFFTSELANAGKGIVEKTETIQCDSVKSFVRDNGEKKNVYLLDAAKPHRNTTQIINQYEVAADRAAPRIDTEGQNRVKYAQDFTYKEGVRQK